MQDAPLYRDPSPRMMDRIYLDHAAATPLLPQVREAMARASEEAWANPSSRHQSGVRARRMLEEARSRTATALGVASPEVFFVSGGTEACNLAILGLLHTQAPGPSGEKRPFALHSPVEHRAVREPFEQRSREGWDIRIPRAPFCGPAEGDGWTEEDLTGAALISHIWVHNETGAIYPVEELSRRCAAAGGVPLHLDAVQAVGKIDLRIPDRAGTLVSLCAHKIGGPRGAGALVIRRPPRPLMPRTVGGGQEGGLRAGTPDVAGAVGLATALELACDRREGEARRLAPLRSLLLALLREGIPDLRLHDAASDVVSHILNVGVPFRDGTLLLAALDLEGVDLSAGSACSSGSSRPSPALVAIEGEEALRGIAPLRFSFGPTTDEGTVREAARRVIAVVRRLREAERP